MLANLDLKRYFRVDRQQNNGIDRERQTVMESAIRLAKSVAMADTPLKLNREQRTNFYDSSMYPSAEFLSLMVHVYAFLIAHSPDVSSNMLRELQKSKQKYLDNMMTAMAHLDTSIRPERMLMYALQSAAMVMQETGRMRQCWRLNSLSCKVSAAISQDLSDSGETLSQDDIRLMRVTHIRSFAFNSALSANMYQPACSARVHLDRSVLDTSKPEYAMLDILLAFAEIQEVIIQETKNCLNSQSYQIDVKRVSTLKMQMRNIRIKIENYRTDAQSATNEFLRFEWLTVNFVFYSMMTSITRLGATPNDYNAQFSGLENARQCLLVLKTLLDVWDQSKNPDLYACSLSCNIVATSDALDFRILEEIADGLSTKIDTSPAIFEIHRLCASLVDLYTSYVDRVSLSASTNRIQVPSGYRKQQQNPRDSRHMPSPMLSDPQLDQDPFGHSIQSGEDPFQELAPWDPLWLDQQLDWSPLCLENIPDLFD
ncbi:unnamed protein product [Clonostachys rosea]|uniref:Transcription factor domain-containing protein n=1 Tax=Bionectria ochroleuca TaxID=29856 RepID=A0ABY6UXY6_BIOOC|nr:unnamed protein product [Clonostachys rosea]